MVLDGSRSTVYEIRNTKYAHMERLSLVYYEALLKCNMKYGIRITQYTYMES